MCSLSAAKPTQFSKTISGWKLVWKVSKVTQNTASTKFFNQIVDFTLFENNLRIMLGYFSFVKNNVLGFIRKIEKSVHLKIVWKFEKNILKVKKIPPEKNSHLMWRLRDLIRDLLRINNILTNPNRDRKLRHSSILLELIPNLATTWKLKANAL